MNHRIVAALGIIAAGFCLVPPAPAAEVVQLTPENWDQYAPTGKEVDAIYGDYVLRNDRIIVVVANPIEGRHANLTTPDVGGCIIDMTSRHEPNDQLTAFYPLARAFSFRAVTVAANGTLICRTNPGVEVRYELQDGWDWVRVTTTILNTTDKSMEVPLVDEIRADRSFERGADGEGRLCWTYDKWWGQAYGVYAPTVRADFFDEKNVRSHRVKYSLADSRSEKVTLGPGEVLTLERYVLCAPHALALRGFAQGLGAKAVSAPVELVVTDPDGPVSGADVEVFVEGKPFAAGRTNHAGRIALPAPAPLSVKTSAVGRPDKSVTIERTSTELGIVLEAPGYVAATITDERGGPIPCKVQFIGREGTADPFFFPDCGEFTVHNCYYSHNGKFRQAISPGKYDVIISRGPEYDAVFTQITVERGSDTVLTGKLVRSVDTAGWISADFHSHASPSGDNTSSQLGRVLNLLAEQIEFAPCTEHNRVDSYTPHLRALGAERWMATAAGIELTGNPLPLNHQNAFPLVHKPRTQDGGGPRTHPDPVAQIERLALWDGGSEKLLQQNHPNIVQLVWDKDLDGKPDEAFKKMLPFMDVIEIHPPHTILQPAVLREGINAGDNRIHAWLQLLNQGIRIPGVGNTDAHYNFHGSGWLRNYIKSPTDDPAKIETIDIVRESEKGHVIVSTGPFMDVSLEDDVVGARQVRSIPGDTRVISSGKARLMIRVQCPNWFDIDRVQVLLNGRPAPALNFTRETTPGRFGAGVVKFDQTLTVQLDRDTHLIVVAIGEKSTLGPVMGPQYGKLQPVAVSNPIYVDVDGKGFEPNGDTLDAPLPLPGGDGN